MPPTPARREGANRPGGPAPSPPRFRFGWRLPLFVLALFAINYWAAHSLVKEGHKRVRVPYSPTFLQQARSENIITITSKGTAVQGTFKQAIKYPPDSKDAKPTTYFRTEIPAFADTDQLAKLLQEHNVTINAQPLDTGPPWWQSLLFGFGPTLLFVALGIWLLRRAGGAGAGGLMSFGRSRARRYEGGEGKVTFADVAGIEEAKAELSEV